MLRNLAVVFGTTLLASSIAHALGMGDIKMKSALNQPLDAEIELVALRGTAVEEIRASLAKDEEFQKAGIERVYALNGLQMSLEGRGADAVIKLRTADPVREPFLNFVVEVNWPNGRLLREYTVLLDPPTFAQEAPKPVVRPSQPVSGTGTVATQPSERPVARQPSGNLSGNTYGPVGSTDTLWSIATRARPNDSVTIQQTLAAIFKANPQAFANNDPNMLLKGETLTIPSAEEIAATPRRGSLAELVGSTPVVQTGRRSGSGSSSEGGGRLVLGAAPDTAGGSARGGTDREAMQVLNQENEALRERLASQQSKIDRLEKLVQLKDQQLATVGAPTTTPETSPPETDVTTVPIVTLPTESPAEQTETTPDSSAQTTPTQAEQAQVAEPEDQKPEKKKPVKTPKKEEEPSFFDDLMSGDGLLYLAGGGGLLLLIIGFMVWQRRRVAQENFHESLLPEESYEQFDSPSQMDTAFDLPEVGEELLPQEEKTETSAPSDLVADPLGEADIYIAYGKYEQAEQLLLRALQEDPDRTELRVKLLEAYAEMHDADKFREQVAEMQDAIDLDPSLAQQVERLQNKAWPDDAMSESYRPAPEAPSADDIFGSMDVGRDSDKTVEIPRQSAPKASAQPVSDFASEEFNLDLDADLGGEPETTVSKAGKASEEEFSFDLSDSEFSIDEEPESKRSSADEELKLDDFDDEFSEPDDLGMNEIDEIATKLDLARAYIEMHETDGAKEILQEVVKDGNDAQRKEAEALLAKI